MGCGVITPDQQLLFSRSVTLGGTRKDNAHNRVTVTSQISGISFSHSALLTPFKRFIIENNRFNMMALLHQHTARLVYLNKNI